MICENFSPKDEIRDLGGEVLNAQKKGLVDKNANAQDSPPTDFDCIITDPTTIESVIHRNESSLIVYIGRPELHI